MRGALAPYTPIAQLTELLVPHTVPLLGKFTIETQCSLVPQWESDCGRPRQTDAPSVRAMHGDISYAIAGN